MIVDHGLQPGSAEVADRARSQLTAMGYTDVVVAPVTVHPSPDRPRSRRSRGALSGAGRRGAHPQGDRAARTYAGRSGRDGSARTGPRIGQPVARRHGPPRPATCSAHCSGSVGRPRCGRVPNSASNPGGTRTMPIVATPGSASVRSCCRPSRPSWDRGSPKRSPEPPNSCAMTPTCWIGLPQSDSTARTHSTVIHLMAQPRRVATADHPALADRPRSRRPLAATHHERRALGDAVARSASWLSSPEVRSAGCPATCT